MATTLNLGKVMVTLGGEHNTSTAYDRLTLVTSGGSSYISKKDVPAGVALTDTTYWQLHGAKGADGTNGEDGTDGEDAYQPFKGWFDSSSALSAAYPNPQVGDFAYVKGATSTDPVAIYACAIAGTWADSGSTFNPANNQEFASGESLNTVHIVDGLEGSSATDVLSAKQGKVLDEKVAALGQEIGEVDVSSKSVDYAGAGTLPGAVVGSTGANASSSNFRRTNFIDVGGYEKIKVSAFVSNVASLTFGYAFYSEDNVESYISGDHYDIDTSLSAYVEKEYVLQIPATARYFRTSIYNAFKQSFKLVASRGQSLSDRLDSVDDEITTLNGQIEDLSGRKFADVAEANLSYVICNSALSSDVRKVDIEGFDTLTGGSIKVLMTNRIVTAAECTFRVNNSTSDAPLYYEGARAGAGNTWASGELVEVFFDGTNWQAFRLKNVVVDSVATENSKNAFSSGAAYTKFASIESDVSLLKEGMYEKVTNLLLYKFNANKTVNSLGKKSTINGCVLATFNNNGYSGYPVLPGSTITASEGYKFNYAVRTEDSIESTSTGTNLELQQNVTGSVTITNAGYLFISVQASDNDGETAITTEEAEALLGAGLSVNLLLSITKASGSDGGGNIHHTNIKNLPWVYGYISTSGAYTVTKSAVVLDRYINVKAGSTITCPSGVKYQARMVVNGSASYQSYSTGTWTAAEDCRVMFGFKYSSDAEFKNFAILENITCDLILDKAINRYDKRAVVNLNGIPLATYRGCHVDDTGLTESTVDYDAFIAPWDALVTSSNGYLTKKDLGETYNGKHLYCYRLGISYDRPNAYKPIIFIVCNVHGHEKTSTLGAFYLMKDLIEHYAENPVLQWIRDNAIIKVIPASNVYGVIYNTRYNENRVNINRNYAAFGWDDFDDTAGGMNNSKGSSPESEIETSIIVNELLSEGIYTALAIDIHTNGRPIDTPSYGNLLYTNWRSEYYGSYDYQMRNVSAAFHANMRGIFDSYGVGGSATDIYGSLRVQKTDPTFERWLAESTNIWGGTLEVPCGYATGIGTRLIPYSADIIKCCAEIIGNYIIQMLYGLAHGNV